MQIDKEQMPEGGMPAGSPSKPENSLQSERGAIQMADEYADFFSLAPDMMCIIDFASARFVNVNPAFSRILGYSDAELLCRSFFDLIHPDDIDETRLNLTGKLAKGISVVGAENRYRRKDGLYRWLEWNAQSHLERGHAYAVVRDITERKRMEQSLRLSEETFKAVLNAITETAYIIDTHGFVLEHNQTFATLNDRSGELLRGKLLFDLIAAESVQRWRARIDEVIKTKKGLRMEDETNGRFVNLSMYPICNSAGDVVKIAVFGQDITWLRKAQETLLLNEERLEALLYQDRPENPKALKPGDEWPLGAEPVAKRRRFSA